jgi:hypothetical protein
MEKCKEISHTAEQMVETKKYTVTITVGEKYWNKELEKYLVPGLQDNDTVLVSETNIVSFITKNPWNIMSLIYNGNATELTIKVL